MALTFTITGLQTQLDAVATAIDAQDYAAALKALAKANAVFLGLPVEVSADGRTVKMRKDLDAMREAVTGLSKITGDRRRLIRMGLSHGGGSNSACC